LLAFYYKDNGIEIDSEKLSKEVRRQRRKREKRQRREFFNGVFK
jgi:hypothetical protein